MDIYDMQLEKRVLALLEKKQPLRITVNVRRTSPLFTATLTAPTAKAAHDAVLSRACRTLGLGDDDPAAACRARLLTVCACARVTVYNFDAWHDGYDWATAHHHHDEVDNDNDGLPVLVVEYAQWLAGVRVAGRQLAREVNKFVAECHEEGGWYAWPPYVRDEKSLGGGEKNPDCRRAIFMGEDGIYRRKVQTPPPGATSVWLDGGEGTVKSVSREGG